jgi:hypothetical protein
MRAIGGRTAAIAAAALVGLTAACTDDAPPPPTPTSSSSTPTSPAPTSTSSTPQPESAEAFIRRWVEADIRMQNTGDAAEYRTLSRPCSACQDFADLVEGFYKRGGFVKTLGWKVLALKSVPGSTRRTPTYLVTVDSRPTTYKESKSGPTKRLPGEQTAYRVSLRAVSTSWLVTDLIEQSS